MSAQLESTDVAGRGLEDGRDVHADVERRSYVERLVRHRCPELTEDEAAAAAGSRAVFRLGGNTGLVSAKSNPTSAPTMVIPPELARQIVSTIELINERLAAVERWLQIDGRA
jgi:hypothetical protein